MSPNPKHVALDVPPTYDELMAASQAGLSLIAYRTRKALPPDTSQTEARLEKAEQAECCKVFRAFGARVYSLSQSRASKQTPGLADLFVIFPGLSSIWFEVKRMNGEGRISAAQQEFHELCNGAQGSTHFIGGRPEAERIVVMFGLAVRDKASGTLEPVRR